MTLYADVQNAGDMIGSLQLQYNRGRQAVITNELIDIITVSCSPCFMIYAELTVSRVLRPCNRIRWVRLGIHKYSQRLGLGKQQNRMQHVWAGLDSRKFLLELMLH